MPGLCRSGSGAARTTILFRFMTRPSLTLHSDSPLSLDNSDIPVLFYLHDPMCSWCWAFRPAWGTVTSGLAGKVQIRSVLGGLAPDSDDPMPMQQRQEIQEIWRTIQTEVPRTDFNFDFWTDCTPRRSTFPACRAVIAAQRQHPRFEEWMVLGIQAAYYLDARNPSDQATLVNIATSIGLEPIRFLKDIKSPSVEAELQRQIDFCRHIGVNSFPSLVVGHKDQFSFIEIHYKNPKRIIRSINRTIRELE